MRVLFVCTDAEIGGAERLLALLGHHWPAEDTLKLVVLMEPGSLSRELERAFDEVVYLNYLPSSRDLFGMVRSLGREVQLFAPDVISSHLFHADLVTALVRTRVPKVSTAHTHGLTSSDHPLTRIIARAVGLLSPCFASFIPSSDSPDMRRFLASLRINNVSPAILNGAEYPDSPTFDPGARVFMSIARSHPVKGHAVLFAAFRKIADQHPEWTLRAIGPGVDAGDATMRHAIAQSGVSSLIQEGRITLEGPTDTPQGALSAASALVISSLYGETSPLIGAEAAGSGVPVITTTVGNCADFADDPRFAVAPGSPEELALAMSEYASLTDDERLDLSTQARQRAEARYAPGRVAAAYRARFIDLAQPQGT